GQPLLKFAAQALKERILLGAARHVGQLLLPRVFVALDMQRADLESLEIAQQLLVILETDAHLGGDLALARRTAPAGRQHTDGLFDRAALAAQLARAPIEGAQTGEDRAPDAELCVDAKRHLL